MSKLIGKRTGETYPEAPRGGGITSGQHGTATLAAGKATITTSRITAGSSILVTREDAIDAELTIEYDVPAHGRSIGDPGSFDINAVKADLTRNTADVSTVNWIVVG